MSFNLLIVGAGNVNFGSTEGPWCHTTRFEKKLGDRLQVVGLVDPDVKRAEGVLAVKREQNIPGYAETKVFASLQRAGEALGGDDDPRLVLLGVQPSVRGSTSSGKDADLQIKSLFPGAAIFTEKPISASSVSDVETVAQSLKGTTTSVGYMLRYLQAAAYMKKLIVENNLHVMTTQATYYMAYEFAGIRADRMGYFNKDRELGPIVGQATHIVDLSRYLAGDADLSSVVALTVEGYEPAGTLGKLLHEHTVPEHLRIPRITSAIWKYKNGATGTLTHGVALHGESYDAELVVIADGWKLRLVDPYGTPKLYVRRPGRDSQDVTVFENDDPFFSEVSTIVDVVEGLRDESAILSSYSDAIQTYALTWAIRVAGEKSALQYRTVNGTS